MLRRLCAAATVVALLAAACAAPPPAPTPVPPTPLPPTSTPIPLLTSTPRPVSALDYGVHMFIANHPETTQRDLRLATLAGFRWQKSLFEWRSIEGEAKGEFDWNESDRVVRASTDAGLKIIARLDFEPGWARKDHANNGPPDDYRDYWDFVSAFVGRYRTGSPNGTVNAIEVWNEPNLDREWGNQTINAASAADYVRLLAGAYKAAHTADPKIIVLTAGLSPSGTTDGHSADDLTYLGWMYDAGLKGTFDAFGAHANSQAPEVAVPLGSLKDFPHPSFYFRRVEQLRQAMVDHGDAAKPVWITEWGWTADKVHGAYSWFAVTEDRKAANLVEGLQYAREHWSPWIGVMSVWTLADPTWTGEREEFWWAIDEPDGTPRPAYTRLQQARASGQLP